MSKWGDIAKAAKQKTSPVPKGQKVPKVSTSGLSAPFGVSAPALVSENRGIDAENRQGVESAIPAPKKPAILPTVSTPQRPEDWLDYYEERAAIAEFDGGLSRPEAEAQTWECCLSSWLNTNPSPETSDGVCAKCGGPLGDHDSIPIARPDGGATWLHESCHEMWMEERRRQAETALCEMGIVS